jgi:hypothetical protein
MAEGLPELKVPQNWGIEGAEGIKILHSKLVYTQNLSATS